MNEEKDTKPTLNDRVLKATGVSLAALVIIVAGNAGPLFDGLMGLPKFLAALATGLPFGAGSYLISQAIGPFLHMFLERWLPESPDNSHRKGFVAETLTLLGCVAICVVQSWGNTSGNMLLACLLGALAGFSSPYISKGFKSLFKES